MAVREHDDRRHPVAGPQDVRGLQGGLAQDGGRDRRVRPQVQREPKRVATTTLDKPEWNATFIEGDVADAVRALKEEHANIVVNGSATLVNYLAKHNLIDEFRIMTFPVVLGTGRKLWDEGTTLALSVSDSWTTKSGVTVTTYAPA